MLDRVNARFGVPALAGQTYKNPNAARFSSARSAKKVPPAKAGTPIQFHSISDLLLDLDAPLRGDLLFDILPSLRLMRDTEIRAAWPEFQRGFPHLRDYFRLARQFENQVKIIIANGAIRGSNLSLQVKILVIEEIAGKVGVWIKADSVILFDDFTFGGK